MTEMTAPSAKPMLAQKGLTRRAFAVGSVMALAAVGSYVAQPKRIENRLGKQKLGSLIPQRIGPWQFAGSAGIVNAQEDVPVDGYDQVLTRVYSAPGMPDVMLLMAYGGAQGGGLQLHRPETCYPGQGFKLSDFAEWQVQLGAGQAFDSRAFTATRDERIERLAYWTRIADSFPLNTTQEYRAIFSSLLAGLVPDGILVRVSAIGADIPASDRALKAFQSALVQEAVAARPVLLGTIMAAAAS